MVNLGNLIDLPLLRWLVLASGLTSLNTEQRESLVDFYTTSGQQKPDRVIIFRDGVSESQFTQVINIELEQIIEACKFLDEKWEPKFTVIVLSDWISRECSSRYCCG